MTWPEWIDRHANLFGMSSENELCMLREWVRVFELEGMSAAELSEASDALARNGHPAYRADFLQPLMAAVREARLRATGRGDLGPRPASSDDCKLCGGIGTVGGLPNFDAMEKLKGMFPHTRYTCMVFCKCPLGLWRKKADRLGVMGFEEYDRAYPQWRETLARWKEQDAARRQAGQFAKAIDAKLGPLERRLKAVVAEKRKGEG